MQYALLLVV